MTEWPASILDFVSVLTRKSLNYAIGERRLWCSICNTIPSRPVNEKAEIPCYTSLSSISDPGSALPMPLWRSVGTYWGELRITGFLLGISLAVSFPEVRSVKQSGRDLSIVLDDLNAGGKAARLKSFDLVIIRERVLRKAAIEFDTSAERIYDEETLSLGASLSRQLPSIATWKLILMSKLQPKKRIPYLAGLTLFPDGE